MKIIIKPYIAIFLASLVLFASCSQYESTPPNQSFDYEANSFFKSNQSLINLVTLNQKQQKSVPTKDISLQIMNNLNKELGTNISHPNLALDLIDYDRDQILNLSLNKGWINQNDIDLNNAFLNDIENYNFDIALANFEKTVLKLNLSNLEFEKQNLFANIVKSFNDIDPSLFNAKTIVIKV